MASRPSDSSGLLTDGRMMLAFQRSGGAHSVHALQFGAREAGCPHPWLLLFSCKVAIVLFRPIPVPTFAEARIRAKRERERKLPSACILHMTDFGCVTGRVMGGRPAFVLLSRCSPDQFQSRPRTRHLMHEQLLDWSLFDHPCRWSIDDVKLMVMMMMCLVWEM